MGTRDTDHLRFGQHNSNFYERDTYGRTGKDQRTGRVQFLAGRLTFVSFVTVFYDFGTYDLEGVGYLAVPEVDIVCSVVLVVEWDKSLPLFEMNDLYLHVSIIGSFL